MLTLVKKRYEELVRQLDALDDQYDPENPPVDYTPVVMTVVNEIADILSSHAFAGDAEEIAFCKEGLIPLLSLARYESEKYAMLQVLYYGTETDFNTHCVFLIRRIMQFINRHFEFFCYCLSGRKDLDAGYFLRNSEANKQLAGLPAMGLDRDTFAGYGLLAATMVAYVRNCRDIEAFYETQWEVSGATLPACRTLQWTDSAIALVELIYALFANGSFNHGQATLKEIAEYIEQVFHIDLGNIYRVHLDTLYRKSGPTAFLDRLRKKLDDLEN
jgi:hypothetical protein